MPESLPAGESMIAVIVNTVSVVLGSLIGLLFRKGMGKASSDAVHAAAGIVSLVIGIKMALGTEHFFALALSLLAGGLLGTRIGIENAILSLGNLLKRLTARRKKTAPGRDIAAISGTESFEAAESPDIRPVENTVSHDKSALFAEGFLNSSVLFCVGAMALVGSFKAGAEGDYSLLLTKSAMDGFMAIMLTASMGFGVAFSAIPVFIYQGALVAASGFLMPLMGETLISELSAAGGALIVMIGLNLLGVKPIKTANFLPALVFMVGFYLLFPYVSFL